MNSKYLALFLIGVCNVGVAVADTQQNPYYTNAQQSLQQSANDAKASLSKQFPGPSSNAMNPPDMTAPMVNNKTHSNNQPPPPPQQPTTQSNQPPIGVIPGSTDQTQSQTQTQQPQNTYQESVAVPPNSNGSSSNIYAPGGNTTGGSSAGNMYR